MKSTRSLTEGALLAAIYAVLLLLVMTVPLLGTLAMVLLPVPFVVYVVRHGLQKALIFSLITILLTWLIATITSLPLTFLFGSAGLVMGHLYRKKSEAFTVLVGASLAFITVLTIVYIGSSFFFGFNIGEETRIMTEESFKTAESILTALGQEPDSEQMQRALESIKLIELLIPTAIILFGVVMAAISQAVSSKIMKRLGYQPAHLPPFRDWCFPRSIIWYYLAVTILMMVGLDNGSILYLATINVFAIIEVILAIQGFSFIFYYFYRKGTSKAVPVLVVLLSFFLPFIGLYIVRIIGIIDLGFDLRKRLTP